jgi:8-oxo-dGTP pyrophosphatase MutT (NUDIX family)
MIKSLSGMTIHIDPEALAARLGGRKPGLAAQMTMVPLPPPTEKTYADAGDDCLQAAVLALLYPRNGALHLVLIRRTSTVLHHKDQISFPGGQVESGETYEQAALREAGEEIGLRPEGVRVLGTLTPLYVHPSHFCVHPLVAVSDEAPEFQPFPGEVAGIIEAPLERLLDPASIRRETWTIRGLPREIPFFSIGPDKIWGATAMILAEFLEILRTLG